MNENALVKYESRSGKMVEFTFEDVKKYMVHGKGELVTIREFMLFRWICESRGLDPTAGDVYIVKYTAEDNAAFITSIDFLRSRAKAQSDCKGWEAGIIVQDEKGEIKKTHGLILEGEKLLGGWFKGYSSKWDIPRELEVPLSNAIKRKKDGTPTRFWSKENQPMMVAKVSESRGLRMIWPDEFKKLYTQEEMPAGDDYDVIDIPLKGELTEETGDRFRDFLFAKYRGVLPENFQKFLELTAEGNGITVDKIMDAKSKQKNFDEFIAKFEQWDKNNRDKAKRGRKPKPQEEPPEEPKTEGAEPEGKKPEKPDEEIQVLKLLLKQIQNRVIGINNVGQAEQMIPKDLSLMDMMSLINHLANAKKPIEPEDWHKERDRILSEKQE